MSEIRILFFLHNFSLLLLSSWKKSTLFVDFLALRSGATSALKAGIQELDVSLRASKKAAKVVNRNRF